MIDAATTQRASGGPFAHLLYSSVLFPILHKLLNHDSKRHAEEYLIESGLPWTVIQPSHLMENFPLAKVLREEEPTYPIPYDPATVFTWTTTKDLACATARILQERKTHLFAVYPLVSTRPGTYHDVVRWFGDAIGKEITIERVSPFEAAEMMAKAAAGGAKDAKVIFKRMLIYYDERGLVGNSSVLEMLLGRKPMSYAEWARVKVGEVRAELGL